MKNWPTTDYKKAKKNLVSCMKHGEFADSKNHKKENMVAVLFDYLLYYIHGTYVYIHVYFNKFKVSAG